MTRSGPAAMSVRPVIVAAMRDNAIDPLEACGVGEPAAMAALVPSALVEVIGSAHRLESMLVARRLAAVAALLRHRLAEPDRADAERGYAVIDGFEQTTAGVAAVMNLSPTAASYLVSQANALDTRMPRVAKLLAEGRTDWRTVRLTSAAPTW